VAESPESVSRFSFSGQYLKLRKTPKNNNFRNLMLKKVSARNEISGSLSGAGVANPN
jgi:hypothetical protein